MNDRDAARIQAMSDEVELVQVESQEKFEAKLPEAEIVISELPPELFARAERARWVAYTSAGIDHLMSREILESDVILTCAKGFVGVHLAEHAMALILGLTRGVAQSARSFTWRKDNLVTTELLAKTMGIVGLGGSGRETAIRAHAFGMWILAVDPTPADVPNCVEACWDTDRFHDLLEASDVVVICAPLTPDTEGMFDREAFGHMKSHALLINVSRGIIIEEEALMAALEQNQIGGAGLDAVPVEPVPDDHPLWQMENVIITPHVAGESPMRGPRWMDTFCENLKRFLSGDENLLSRFDQSRGY